MTPDERLLDSLLRRDWAGAEQAIRAVVWWAAERMIGELVEVRYQDAGPKPQRRVHPIVYIPVEIKTRELAAKLNVARELVDCGFTVIIGQCWSLQRHGYAGIPAGIVLFKTLNNIDAHNMGRAIENGHLIAAMDEESFGRPPTPALARLNTHPFAAARADLICVQSETHAAYLRDTYPVADKITVTGNPRAALMRSVAADPPMEPGYDLLCSNAGCVNNIRGFSTCTWSTLNITAFNGMAQAEKDYLNCCLYELDILRQLIDQAERSGRPVLRPHPMESHAFWKSALPGAVVRNDLPVQWWMKHAAAVYVGGNCGCVTEARMIGVKPIKLHGIAHEFPDHGEVEINDGDAVSAIANALADLYADNKSDQAPRLMWPASGFEPGEFHRNKFPATDEQEIRAAVPGKRVQRLEENVFVVSSA